MRNNTKTYKLTLSGKRIKHNNYDWVVNRNGNYFPLDMLEDEHLYKCIIEDIEDDYTGTHTYRCEVDIYDDIDEFTKTLKNGQLFILMKPDGSFSDQIVKVIKSGDEVKDIKVIYGYDYVVRLTNIRYDYKQLTKKILNDYIVSMKKKAKIEYLESIHKFDNLMNIFKNEIN